MPTFRQDTKIGGMVPMMKTDDINDQAITKDKIRDGNVTAEKLADGAVSTDKLPDGAIKTPKIADGNITTSKLAEASVVTSKIADQNVTNEKIADQSVDNSKLSPEAVTYDKLKDNSVITEKLNDRAVTTEKIEEKAITNTKLGDQSVDDRVLREASVEDKHIKNNAVSTPKIASRSVTREKIAYNSVSRAELTPDVRSFIDKKADAEQVNNSLYDLEKKIGERFVVEGDVTNLPDEEDLTSVKESEHDVLKLADRSYAPEKFSGKGYKILRRNIKQISIAVTKIQIESAPSADGTLSFTVNGKETQVAVSATTDNTTALVSQKVASVFQESMTEYEVSTDTSIITLTRKSGGSVTPSVFSASTTGVVCTILDSTKIELRNILTPAMINQPNTIYDIRYDFDLNNNTIDIPENCILKFKGGTFNNGFITNYYNCIYPEMFGAIPNDNFDCTDAINKAAKLAEMTNTTLHFSDGIYKVTNTLNLSAINICGNCATIKGYMSDESPIIHIDARKGQQWSSFNKRTRIIENLIIDCNSKNNIGIKIYGDQQMFNNIHIIHVGWLGFYLFGGGSNKITNMYIEGDNNSLDYSKGMCLMSTDTEVSNLTIQNVSTGVIATSSNQFTNVHTWGYSTRKNMYVHLICIGKVIINNWYFDTAPSSNIKYDDNCDFITIQNDDILKRQYSGGCAILCLEKNKGFVISTNVSFSTGEVQDNHTPKCIFISDKSEHTNKCTILNEVISSNWKLCTDEDTRNIIKFSKYDKIIPLTGTYSERPSRKQYNLKVGQPYYATDLYAMLFWQGDYFIDPLGDVGLHYGRTIERPDITNATNLYYYDNSIKKLLYGHKGVWKDALGNNPDLATKGTTNNRPTLSNEDAGFEYYDTTLKKKILWNGINWVNVDGTALGT